MNKLKLFVENFLIYGMGGIINKIIPLIMVPIVTRLMPNTTYYGLSDLSNTVVSFGSSLAVMGMYDAMYRMFFEKDQVEYKKKICSTALLFTLISSLFVFMVMLLLKDLIAKLFFGDEQYAYLVYLSAMATFVGATNSIIAAPTRMQNKRKVYLVTNTIGPLLSYTIAIPLLLSGHYVIALPLAAVISGVTLESSFAIMNRHWFSLKKFDAKLLKPLLFIALPLFPNFLIYWLYNSCDKVMITNIIGVGAAGIYSVGSKLGHCSQLIYTAFSGGWQYFAFSTMKEKDQVKSNSAIFEYLGIISFVATSFICAWSYFLFKVLFTEQYLEGYTVAPYLFLAPLLQMLFQVACNQFIVIKKTWPNMFILLGGAIVNIFGNFVLIPVLGIEGAAISTLSGYIISDIVCVVVLIKMKLMLVSLRFIYAFAFMAIYMFIWRIFIPNNTVFATLLALTLTTIYLLMYRKELKFLSNIISKKVVQN